MTLGDTIVLSIEQVLEFRHEFVRVLFPESAHDEAVGAHEDEQVLAYTQELSVVGLDDKRGIGGRGRNELRPYRLHTDEARSCMFPEWSAEVGKCL